MGDKGGRCVGLTTLPPSGADCLKIWEPHSPGSFRDRPGLYSDCFTFSHMQLHFHYNSTINFITGKDFTQTM
jgi:hypothetical protein